ncbi:sodium calcium [Paraphaeosphaeria minitans]|uniref:Sodium calcium n=1 Tax=Paraphaeosphaeria minitans TaxID=565426 RepID=A0A9P6G502_9PLEO|nr:sodium calcium [Paraphaeosphaeria minitans]
MRPISTFLRSLRHAPAQLPSFWCLCFIAVVSFIASSALFITSATSTTRFLFALLALLTTAAVQKFTVLELVVILLARKRASCAIIFEALLSNWTEASLAIAAASKGQSDLVRAFLVGAIAINHLLLLGICFIQGGHHGRRTSYPMLMASLHIRMLPMYVVLMLPPIAFEVGSQGSDSSVVRTARITALLLLLLFICHLVLVCRLHSTHPVQAHVLHKMAYAHEPSNGTEPLAYGTSMRITASMASRIQAQKENWLWEQLLLSDTAADSRQPWDSALTTVTLLLSCGASLVSCFQLVNSISPDNISGWTSPLRVGYLIAPFFTSASGLGATFLHRRGCTTPLNSGQVVCGAIMSTTQLLCLILPATILTRWIVSLGQGTAFLDPFQIALLGGAVILPMYFIQTGGDDW